MKKLLDEIIIHRIEKVLLFGLTPIAVEQNEEASSGSNHQVPMVPAVVTCMVFCPMPLI